MASGQNLYSQIKTFCDHRTDQWMAPGRKRIKNLGRLYRIIIERKGNQVYVASRMYFPDIYIWYLLLPIFFLLKYAKQIRTRSMFTRPFLISSLSLITVHIKSTSAGCLRSDCHYWNIKVWDSACQIIYYEIINCKPMPYYLYLD